ncbi:MAG TPA: iron-sulfur cluster assembly accessory protein [Gammaproteobacteria bacterium]|nr:iron-sulfur cluster assembly accessory protein [Gammaproteobacteria bacterium]
MMTITPSAAEQIKASASQQDVEDMALRIAAKKVEDGSIEYAMGFADQLSADDLKFTSEGIEVVLAPTSALLLKDAVIDYVEIEPGQHNFIFSNPNDPHHKSPE